MKISRKVFSFFWAALMAFSFAACLCTSGHGSAAEDAKTLGEAQAVMRAQYGENKRISAGSYDQSLAVKCVNGTFVGRKNEGVIAYKGIPFVGRQPVGELRWKAPVDVVPDDGVYTEGNLTIANAPMDFKAAVQFGLDTYKLHDRNIQPDNFWQTWHTAVYDLAKRTLRLNIQEDYSKHYDFKLE